MPPFHYWWALLATEHSCAYACAKVRGFLDEEIPPGEVGPENANGYVWKTCNEEVIQKEEGVVIPP